MKRIVAGLILLVGAVSTASAGNYCYGETVTVVIMQGDAIFFETDKSCPSWCSVNASWSATAQARAFAMLTAAKVAGLPVSLYWNEQTAACSPTELVYASPVIIMM